MEGVTSMMMWWECKTKKNIEKPIKQLLRKNLLVLAKVHTQQQPPKGSRTFDISCDIFCDMRWDKLQQTWSKSDQIVRKIIAHARRILASKKRSNWMERK